MVSEHAQLPPAVRELYPWPGDYLRIRGFQFADAVDEFIAGHDRVYVIDQNRDGQMLALLRNEIPHLAGRLRSIRHYDGMPVPARAIVDGILSQEETA